LHCEFLHSVEVECIRHSIVARVGSMAKLGDLAFSKGVIAEAVVSTYKSDGKPNAAPMGVVMEDDSHLTISLFNSSSTCRNLKVNKCAVVNVTNDVEVFYKAAFKEANPNGELPGEWFESASAVNAPKLRLVDATIEVSIDEFVPIGAEKTRVTCKVENVIASKQYPHVYCRALAATLEAIIHATRVKVFIEEENKKKQVCELMKLIEKSRDVVDKVAPQSKYALVMADLMKRIDSWSRKNESFC